MCADWCCADSPVKREGQKRRSGFIDLVGGILRLFARQEKGSEPVYVKAKQCGKALVPVCGIRLALFSMNNIDQIIHVN